MKLNEVLVYVRSFRVFDIQVAIAVFTYPADFLISSSGAYTWEGGGGGSGEAYKRQFMQWPCRRKVGKRFGSSFTTYIIQLILHAELRNILN